MYQFFLVSFISMFKFIRSTHLHLDFLCWCYGLVEGFVSIFYSKIDTNHPSSRRNRQTEPVVTKDWKRPKLDWYLHPVGLGGYDFRIESDRLSTHISKHSTWFIFFVKFWIDKIVKLKLRIKINHRHIHKIWHEHLAHISIIIWKTMKWFNGTTLV